MTKSYGKPLVEIDTEINVQGTYYSVTISKKYIDGHVLDLGQPIHIAIWQEGRV